MVDVANHCVSYYLAAFDRRGDGGNSHFRRR
jgi:hypothetical protein